MNNTLSSYLVCSALMVIIMGTLAVRSFSAVSDRKSRVRTQFLIGMTALYVIVDFVFIACHLSGGLTVDAWTVVAFVFYLVYTLLPFGWHLFVRNFVGSTFGLIFRRLELVPIVVLLGMVVATPFTGALYYFDDAGMYARGPLYDAYSILNYFYYAECILDLLIILIRQKQGDERYAFRTMLISLIMLVGAVVNSSVLPVGTILPFMPFCSVVVTMFAFYFIAAKDSDLLKERQEKAIQTALKEAREANQAKTIFLSRVSHDIRTPMNAIINLTELARQENDPARVHEYLNKMAVSGKFLLVLINDILDMSRIESGELTLHRESLTRSEFLATVETIICPLMEEKHINFHSELNPGEYTILVDKMRFNQIFFNLLANAAKFTPEGGDVWFEVTNLEAADNRLKIKFVVRDNGIGMSEEFQQHLFEPFAQESSKLNEKKQGTGLGLSIVKNLVDTIGGTISVKSKLGEGTEFVVMFEVDILAREGASSSSSSSSAVSSSLDGLRVLLVEDNETNTYVAKIILEKVGCVVSTAENGQEAVDAFSASEPNTFDAILMDVRMPVMDGIEATKAIRALDRPDAASVAIVAMTADTFDDERKNMLEIGMNYHLPKPIDAQMLYEILQTCSHRPD